MGVKFDQEEFNEKLLNLLKEFTADIEIKKKIDNIMIEREYKING